MNLMDLMVQIEAKDLASAVIRGVAATAKSATQSITSAFDGVGDGMTKSFGAAKKTLDGIIATLGKVGGVVAGVSATGVGALAKNAVESYADYEQLVGGIETLFGAGGRSIEEYALSIGKSVSEAKSEFDALVSAQNKLFANADSAYKTAGLSANDYMDTATSFAASLISALGGDTVAAADMVQTAITDMADNANKMGSNIGSIQDAYRGFAKQNYTMLDNLKLGYGGTAGEMARLLNDANKIDSTILGKGVSLATTGQNILDGVGLDQMIRAINVIQTEMDITGTTAKEASTTIQGSVGSAKAAWSDMMTAIADDNADFGGSIDKVVSSTTTALQNLIPQIQQSFVGISKLIGSLAPTVVSAIPQLVSSALPGITSAMSGIISSAAQAIPGLVNAVISSLPAVVESFAGVGETLVSAVANVAKTVTNALANFFEDFAGIDVSPILKSFEGAISTVGELLTSAFDGISVDTAPVDKINDSIRLLSSTIDWLLEVVHSGAFSGLSTTIFNAFSQIGGSLAEHMKPAVDAFGDLIGSFMAGDSGHIDRIKSAVESFVGIFTEHISPIIGAISTAIVNVLGAFLEVSIQVIEGIVNALKGFFGISENKDMVNRFQILADAVGKLFRVFTDLVAPIIDAIKIAVSGLFDYFFSSEADITFFGQVVDSVVEIFRAMADNIETAWGQIKELVAVLTDSETPIRDKLVAIKQYFVDSFNNSLETVKRLITAVGTTLVAAIKNAIGLLKDLIGIGDEASEVVGGTTHESASGTIFGGGGGSFGNTGKNVSSGLADGIKSGGKEVSDAVTNVLEKAEAAAKKATESHSPSRRYMKLGGYMIDGLRIGWKSGVGKMLGEMRSSYEMMERLQNPILMTTLGDSALLRSTADVATAILGSSAVSSQASASLAPVNLVVDGKTLATAMIDPMRDVMKQRGVKVLNA